MNSGTKKLLSLLVVFAMVLSMAPSFTLPVFAAGEGSEESATPTITYGVQNIADTTLAADVAAKQQKAKDVRDAYPALKAALQAGTTTYTCPMCSTENAVWTEIGSNGKALWTGNKTDTGKYHYFINGAVGSAEEPKFNGNIAQSTGSATMCFALLDAEAYVQTRFHVSGNSTFNFMGEGFISTGGHTDYANCGLFTVNPDTTQKPTLNLYGGTYMSTTYANTTVGKTYGANTQRGVGVIHNSSAGAGATINMFDGVVIGQTVAEGATLDTSYEQYNAYITGTFNMYGGTIQNSVSDQNFGGMIVAAGGTVNMFDGTITGGTNKTDATYYRGNVHVKDGTFNMYGGTISNGKAGRAGNGSLVGGGNIYIDSASAVVNLVGGTITGGHTDGVGGNIAVWNAKSLTISGKALIEKGTASKGGNLGVADAYCSSTTDHQNPDVTVDITGGKIADGEAKRSYSTNDHGGVGGNIYMGSGKDSTEHPEEIRVLNINNGALITGGKAVDTNDNVALAGKGGNIAVAAFAVVNVDGADTKVTLGQAGAGGNISTANVTDSGVGSAKINVLGGEVSYGTSTSTADNFGGGNIYLYGGSEVTVSGGTVSYGEAAKSGGNISVRNDGAKVTVTGTGSVIYGEAVSGGGGNIRAFNNADVVVSGGTVSNGTAGANGGNIWITTNRVTATVSGGVVHTGAAAQGGNIYADSTNASSFVKISGGSIYKGTATGNGGNVRTSSGIPVTMEGGFVYDGVCGTVAENASGGNFFLTSPMTVTGGSIYNGDAPSAGGNIWTNYDLSVSNAAIYDGTAKAGANINVDGKTLTIGTGAAISGGTIKSGGSQGCGVRITSGTVNMTGGTVSYGSMDSVWLIDSVMNMSGGKVYAKNSASEKNAGIKLANTAEETYSQLYLSGDASVVSVDETAASGEIFVYGAGIFAVDPNWTGKAGVTYKSMTLENNAVPTAQGYVGTLTGGIDATETGTFSGTLWLGGSGGVVQGQLNGVNGALVLTALDTSDKTFDPAGNNGIAYCEACGAHYKWIPYTEDYTGDETALTAATHMYLTDNVTYTKEHGLVAYTNVCFHLNGKNFTAGEGGRIAILCSMTCNIIGEGTMTGGVEDAALQVNGANAKAVYNIYSGTFKRPADSTSPIVNSEGNGGTVNFYGGTIDAADGNTVPAIRLEGGKDKPAVFNANGGKILTSGTDAVDLATEYASLNVTAGAVDGYVTGTVANATAGSGYTKYAVDGKAVIADAAVESFGPGWINIDSSDPTNDIRVNTKIENAAGMTDLKVEILDADGNVLTTVMPESYNVPASITSVNICAMVIGDSGSWKQDKEFTANAVPASAKLYVNGMSVPVKTCVINGADKTAQLTATEWARYFNMDANLFAVNGDGYCFGLFDSLDAAQAAATTGRTIAALRNMVAEDVVKLESAATIDLNGKTLYVDLNGKKLTLTGTGAVCGVDTANDNYVLTDGAVTVADGITVEKDVTVDGKRYIALKEADGSYSFHRLDVGVSYVTIRTTEAGLYYKAQYKADADLLAAVSVYGVVLSVNNMPGANWTSDGEDVNLSTEYFTSETPLVFDEIVTSGSVFGIMKKDGRTPETNADYGKRYIYANPYLKLNDGTILMADTANVGKTTEDNGFNGVAYSLYSSLERINDNWDNTNVVKDEATKKAVKAFYDTWAGYGMSAWAADLTNIVNYTA